MKRVTILGLQVGDFPSLDESLEGASFPMVFLCEDGELDQFMNLGYDISLDALEQGLSLHGIHLTESVRADLMTDTNGESFVYFNQEEIEVEEV